ncbi:MAG: late competence development ComFB family protein [Gemmatimonadetes bacterium]|nr:late competence development ComFB family protein [Gemmatimonadota bacterium]MCB9505388.1 late competence development ComFB family protein [Gemmatimonadales bacterium]MCA9763688.1 late competence development ComFB family protein [Gemmatimonadota bacterium]MCA9767998.1 late competence development ComFB family protein [Gemmatimonadota bacterium]HPF61515.1 late competence development ComFB family protein [Gemmatimonadales bacterium]
MILNVMEHHVLEAYHRLRDRVDGFKHTPGHQEDVVVYALNRLPPKYVVSEEGKAVTEVALDAPQQRAAIEVQVIEALKLVARVPREVRRDHTPGS